MTAFGSRAGSGSGSDSDPDGSEAIPAATVILVRDGDAGLETLMLRRNSDIAFGGHWVFPGGRIEPADREGVDDLEYAARRAAVREALEEVDLRIDESSLCFISHWTPPSTAPRRFATWFFIARAPDGAVTVDGSEIHEEQWMRPIDALARRDAQEVELAPPTWVTIHSLLAFDTVDALLADARSRPPTYYVTHMTRRPEFAVATWDGDVAYESGDFDAPGPRNRLVMWKDGWRLERTDTSES